MFFGKKLTRHEIQFQVDSKILLTVQGCVVPRVGELVGIEDKFYVVARVIYHFLDPKTGRRGAFGNKIGMEMTALVSLEIE